MPALVGNISINSVGSSAIVSIGDSFYLSPKSSSKTYAGAGSFITGDFLTSNNSVNTTNVYDSDLLDSNIAST